MLRIRRIMAVADENARHLICIAHLNARDDRLLQPAQRALAEGTEACFL
jgi:hypothetical protein